jgi:FHA domain/Domain of unknown function (DUF1707)
LTDTNTCRRSDANAIPCTEPETSWPSERMTFPVALRTRNDPETLTARMSFVGTTAPFASASVEALRVPAIAHSRTKLAAATRVLARKDVTQVYERSPDQSSALGQFPACDLLALELDRPKSRCQDPRVRGGRVARASAREREQVAERLRGACVDERLSVGTFIARLDDVYSARTQPELEQIVADLPEPSWLTRTCVAAVDAGSRFTQQLQVAWQHPRAAHLTLPTRSPAYLGRSRDCDYALDEEFVSRKHAVITYEQGRWRVQDCGSTNGTYLNGWLVKEATEIHPGDELTLGDARFVLQAPRPS